MAFNLGINVVEVDGRAAPTIVAAPISTAGFLIQSQRGAPSVPVRCRSIGDVTTAFGGHIAGAFGSHALQGFFGNGGSDAVVVRVASATSTAAATTLNDRAGAPTLTVSAGSRGRLDPGAWGNALAVAVLDHPRATSAIPAQILGTATEPFGLANGQTLSVAVNGGTTPVVVTFSAGSFANIAAATAAEVAAAIRRQTTAFRVAQTPTGALLLGSAASGTASRLDVAAGAAATALGFTGATANSAAALPAGTTMALFDTVGGLLPGSAVRIESRAQAIGGAPIAAALPANSGIAVTVDGAAPVVVAFAASDFSGGLASVRPDEVVTAINRQARGFSAALTSDGHLVLQSNSYGTASSIALAAPGGLLADATTALGLAAVVPTAGAAQSRAIVAVSAATRLVAWTGALATPANAGRLRSVEFDLVVTRAGAEVERFEALSMQPGLDYTAVTVINDGQAGSRYVTVTDLAGGSGPGQNAPAVTNAKPLTSGVDGGTVADADYIGDPSLRTGLFAFDTQAVQLLACPETTAPAVVDAALAYCEQRGDAMYVGTAPSGYALEDIKTYAAPFRGRKVYGALYAPWIQIVNPVPGGAPYLWVPPVGHVLGVYARVGNVRGVAKAPAGDEALLNNALAVQLALTDTEHTDLVKNGSVNGIRAIPGAGIIIDASRTLSTDTRWYYVNVRRLFNFIKTSLRDGLRFVAQEPNSEELRRSVKFNVVTPFLLGLWRQGAFGSDPPDKVFTVVCDAGNNPPSEVNLGNFKIEVYFYPVKPAETIVIIVGQQDSAAAAAER